MATDPDHPDLTLGRVVRIALRRLLLSLLGDRADWDRVGDPVAAEYVAELEQQLREERRYAAGHAGHDAHDGAAAQRGGGS